MLFYLITFLIVIENIFFFYWQIKKYKIINATTYSLTFAFICYVLVPIFYFMGLLDIHEMYKVGFSDQDVNHLHILANALILVFYTMFFLGYFSKKNTTFIIKDNMNFISIKRHLVFLSFFSMVTFILFVYMYGGFDYILSNISQIRSGTDENKSYLGAFLRMFTDYMLIFFLALFFYKISTRSELLCISRKNIRYLVVLFYVVLIIILAKKFTDGGRGGLISIAILMIIMYSLKYKRINWKYLIITFVFAISIIIFGKTILFQLFTGQEFSSIEIDFAQYGSKILLEFAYPYISLINSLHLDLSADRMFFDFFAWMYKILKLFGINDMDSISYYNTYHLIGMWESNIPPGIIAFLFIEGGVFFIPIGAFFVGVLFSYLDILIYRISFSNNPLILAITTVMITQFSRVINNTDIALVIQSLFVYILLISYLHLFKYVKLYRVNLVK